MYIITYSSTGIICNQSVALCIIIGSIFKKIYLYKQLFEECVTDILRHYYWTNYLNLSLYDLNKLFNQILSPIETGKNLNNQAHSCPRGLHLSASWSPMKGPPGTSRTSQHCGIEGFELSPHLGVHCAKRRCIPDSDASFSSLKSNTSE